MNPQNRPIADAFARIASLLELQRADPARVRTYRRASHAIASLPESVRWMIRQGERLPAVDALGEPMVTSAAELAETGTCAVLQRLEAEVTQDYGELLDLPHLGPQRVRALHEELGISTLEQLHAAAASGRLQSLAGFGPRLEKHLLKATEERLARVRRMRVDVATVVAQRVLAWTRDLPYVGRAAVAGELRRGCDSVAELSIVAESMADREVIAAFTGHPEVRDVPFAGRARAGVVLHDDVRVELQVASAEQFGLLWLLRTGSAAHVQALGRQAESIGLTFDEGGVRRRGVPLDGSDEASLYGHLGMLWVPPELREDRGEVEAASHGRLPRLVGRGDLQGDLHVQCRQGAHETALEVIAQAAQTRGLRYIAIADDARRILPSRVNDIDRLARQMAAIDAYNATAPAVRLLKGVNVSILEDGRLNLPDAVLRHADLVVASPAHPFDLSRARQTSRLLRAMDNRCFSILGAPTGRLIEERRPAVFDLQRVLAKARERGCFVELDGRAARLDLDHIGCRAAQEAGVLVSINSCAADEAGFDGLDRGIVQARRGWLEAPGVLNTRPLAELMPLLAATMDR